MWADLRAILVPTATYLGTLLASVGLFSGLVAMRSLGVVEDLWILASFVAAALFGVVFGQIEAASADLDRAVEMATVRPDLRLSGLSRASRAVLRMRQGDRDGAEHDWGYAVERLAPMGPGHDAVELAVLGADLAAARGDPALARAAVNRARRTLSANS